MKTWILAVAVIAGTAVLYSQNKHDAKGEAVFGKFCVACHGPDGKSQTDLGLKMHAADLTSKTVQTLSDERLIEVVTSGNLKMPKFGDKLSSAEIKSVVAYVRQLGNP